jgi:hypothetical protein
METGIAGHRCRDISLYYFDAYLPRNAVFLDRHRRRSHHRTCLGSHVRRERCSARLEMRHLVLSIRCRSCQVGGRSRSPHRPGTESLFLESRRGKLAWVETWNDLAIPWGS